jgi:hypothetical protein
MKFNMNAQRTLHWLTFSKRPGYWENVVDPSQFDSRSPPSEGGRGGGGTGDVVILHCSSSPKPWESGAKRGDLEMVWWASYTAFLAAPPSAATSRDDEKEVMRRFVRESPSDPEPREQHSTFLSSHAFFREQQSVTYSPLARAGTRPCGRRGWARRRPWSAQRRGK